MSAGQFAVAAILYLMVGLATWALVKENFDDDEALGIATVWPISLVVTVLWGITVGSLFWAKAMGRLSARGLRAFGVARATYRAASVDPIEEAARREVEKIAPSDSDA